MSGAPNGEGLGEPLPMQQGQEQAVCIGPTAAMLEEGGDWIQLKSKRIYPFVGTFLIHPIETIFDR